MEMCQTFEMGHPTHAVAHLPRTEVSMARILAIAQGNRGF